MRSAGAHTVMLRADTAAAARRGFLDRAERAGRRGQEVLARAEAASQDHSQDVMDALRWLYANSPLSDMANYDFGLFLSCAAHGAFLRERSPLARGIPEEIFLPYVLHSRVNEEELCDCRRLFHGLLAERTAGLSPERAAIEINYWCAEQAAYQSTDLCTASALAVYRSGCGRCGEESVFTVNALRALGIPARQVYVPRWSHCDDNHAWVEVWLGDGWHFLGACEPEELLDRGWFTNAAGRALLVHSRLFGGTGEEPEALYRAGAAVYLGHTERYAAAKPLTILVRDRNGKPVEGAQASFSVLNFSEEAEIASMTTAPDGTAQLPCGLGSILLHVRKDASSCRRQVYVPNKEPVEIILGHEEPAQNVWEDFTFRAPQDRTVQYPRPTAAQQALRRRRNTAAGEARRQRAAAMLNRPRSEAAAEASGLGRRLMTALEESRGNADRLLDFLEGGAAEARAALLLTLTAKDWRDVDPAVLEEALTLPGCCPDVEEALYYSYIACPRVYNEPLRPCRRTILEHFSQEEQAVFRVNPRVLWTYIQENLGFEPDIEYDHLLTLPGALLSAGGGSSLSKKILFVSACRALGVAARLRPMDLRAEFYAGDRFIPADPRETDGCTVTLAREPDEDWQYGTDFSVGRLMDGVYRTLDLSGAQWKANQLSFPAGSGSYRVLTSERLPSGDVYASAYHFHPVEGETPVIRLHKRRAKPEEMLGNFPLEEFQVTGADGRTVQGSELTREGALLLWLEEGAEPTEHLLGELLESAAGLGELPAELVFLVRDPAALENSTLRRTLAVCPHARVCYDDIEHIEAVARRLYLDPEKLPLLAAVSSPLLAVYASGGYNVGGWELAVKVCRAAMARKK